MKSQKSQVVAHPPVLARPEVQWYLPAILRQVVQRHLPAAVVFVAIQMYLPAAVVHPNGIVAHLSQKNLELSQPVVKLLMH